MNLLSRSIVIMFLFDIVVYLFSTIFWFDYFKLPLNFMDLTVMITVLSGVLVLFLKDNYKVREFNVTLKNYYLLFEGVVFPQIPAAILLLMFADSVNSLEFLLVNLLTIFVLLRTYRILFHYYLFNIKRIKNVLIVGAGKNARLMADEIINKKALKMNVVGFIGDNEDKISNYSVKTLAKSLSLQDVIRANKIDIVIIAAERYLDETVLTDMVKSIPKGVKIYEMRDFYEMVTGKYFVDSVSINNLFFHYMKNRSVLYDICKRIYDVIAATIILLVTFPILLYIAIRVKITDGGNPIYTQNRIGKDGKVFKAYKLRTMYKNDYIPTSNNLELANGQDGDSRVIPWCKFVRKARFDEIPQMVNILKGDMSIVGPRAEWEDLVHVYCQEIPMHKCRHWVKTGWTGWAQINQGHCFNGDDEKHKLEYDFYYIKHRNVFWEILILIKAIFLALGARHG